MANELLPLMETIRQLTDLIETNVSKEDWPLPDYNDILFKSMLLGESTIPSFFTFIFCKCCINSIQGS